MRSLWLAFSVPLAIFCLLNELSTGFAFVDRVWWTKNGHYCPSCFVGSQDALTKISGLTLITVVHPLCSNLSANYLRNREFAFFLRIVPTVLEIEYSTVDKHPRADGQNEGKMFFVEFPTSLLFSSIHHSLLEVIVTAPSPHLLSRNRNRFVAPTYILPMFEDFHFLYELSGAKAVLLVCWRYNNAQALHF